MAQQKNSKLLEQADPFHQHISLRTWVECCPQTALLAICQGLQQSRGGQSGPGAAGLGIAQYGNHSRNFDIDNEAAILSIARASSLRLGPD